MTMIVLMTCVFFLTGGMLLGMGTYRACLSAGFRNNPTVHFLLFDYLRRMNRVTGRDLQTVLASLGFAMSRPSFYLLMSRLEGGKLVRGWYEDKILEQPDLSQVTIKERWYELGPAARSWVEGGAVYRGHRAPGMGDDRL